MSEANIVEHDYRAEVLNALTHAVGAALSVAALCYMVIYASSLGDTYRVVSVSVFGASLVALYSASTVYHAVQGPFWKHVFHVIDHASIYVLIAGTYTPFTLVSIRGGWGWSLFGVVWGLALAGIIFKIFFVGRMQFLSLAVYLGMGWLAIIAAGPIMNAVPFAGIVWVVVGGLAYTSGVVFYVWHSLPHHHAIWHLFTMAGSASHFVAIYWYVLPV